MADNKRDYYEVLGVQRGAPELFYIVNESVWTGYPMKDDGSNIPPTDCTDGYGIAALYNLTLVE